MSFEAVSLTEAVITADLLQSRLNGAQRVRVGLRAILTPSARDLLRARNVELIREAGGSTAGGATGKPAVRWQALVSRTRTQAEAVIENLQATGVAWELHLTGLPHEAARQAASALCRGEAAGVVVFAEHADVVACLANRNPAVRAASVATAQHTTGVRQHLGANLLAINPVGRSFFELRTMLNAFTAAGAPQPPAHWGS